MWTGYGCSRIRWNISALRAACFQARGWRSLSLGAIAIRVPERWGPVEVGDDGGLVIHNRPAWLRVDGDAVWYGSAIELRVYSSAHPPPVCVAPMRETRRTLKTDSETITLVLRIANGSGAQTSRNRAACPSRRSRDRQPGASRLDRLRWTPGASTWRRRSAASPLADTPVACRTRS